MKKSFYLLGMAAIMMASCTSDEFVGENQSAQETNELGAIMFTSNTPNITRATGNEAATKLDFKFNVYGVKNVGSDYINVFAQGQYNADDNTPYWAWYVDATAGSSTSNSKGWEYVGTAGNYGTTEYQATLTSEQYIKYWDYAASQYEFVAYSATSATPATVTSVDKAGFHVNGTADQIAALYIADRKVVEKSDANYKAPVTLTFRSAAAKVRLGIYETIPGYDVKQVKFYYNNKAYSATDVARLDGSFNGDRTKAYDFNVTYEATPTTTGGSEYRAIVSGVTGNNTTYFNFGSFTCSETNLLGTESTAPTWANGSKDYINVLPNVTNVGPMTLTVDYILWNSTTQEEITVKGATAVVPEAYMKWQSNYAYTYLFKISDNTNGTTGNTGDPAGLYPITFDAVTIDTQDADFGTVTTVTTPSITTYQEGSVTVDGIKYVKDKEIDVTIQNGSAATNLSATGTEIKVYSVTKTDGTPTEADMTLTSTSITKTAKSITVGTADKSITVNGTEIIKLDANHYATFTPDETGYYAIEYNNGTAKYYKIVVVE